MAATPLEGMEARQVDRFWRWAERFKDVPRRSANDSVATAGSEGRGGPRRSHALGHLVETGSLFGHTSKPPRRHMDKWQ
jgi:hypothetical protein